jgi:NHL repeat
VRSPAPTEAPCVEPLPRELLAPGPHPVWELGRRLSRPGRVRRDGVAVGGYRCASFRSPVEILAVHATRGPEFVGISGRVRRWAPSGAADDRCSFAAVAREGVVAVLAPSGAIRWSHGERHLLVAGLDGGPPSTVALAWPDTVIAAYPERGAVVVRDLSGRVLRRLDRADGVAEPVGVYAHRDGDRFLVADARRHQVLEFTLRGNGRPRPVFGTPGRAGKRDGQLNAPTFASYTSSGGVLITDTKNNRILRLDRHGALDLALGRVDAYSADRVRLWYPRTADEAGDGTLVVAEGRGGRLLRIDGHGRMDVIGGDCDVRDTALIQPRGAHFGGRERILVSDCHNDRILVTRRTGEVLTVIGESGAEPVPELDWPRYAIDTGAGYAVADGRNRRIVFTTQSGGLRRKLSHWSPAHRPEPHPFEDPHHLHLVRGGTGAELIVTDSGSGHVLRMGFDGVATTVWSGLSDPHMALPCADGGVLVCDTGNDRLVELSRDGAQRWVLDADVVARDTGRPLSQPRSMALLPDGSLVVVDTGNHRLVHWSRVRGAVCLEPVVRRLAGSLYFPRHVSLDHHAGVLLISDFDNSRLVFVPLARALGSDA